MEVFILVHHYFIHLKKETKKAEIGGFHFGSPPDQPIKASGRGGHQNLSEVYKRNLPFLKVQNQELLPQLAPT